MQVPSSPSTSSKTEGRDPFEIAHHVKQLAGKVLPYVMPTARRVGSANHIPFLTPFSRFDYEQ